MRGECGGAPEFVYTNKITPKPGAYTVFLL